MLKNLALPIWKQPFWKLSFWQQWARVAKPADGVASLTPRKIYIIPTRWGFLYGLMLLALLVGSINYSVSLGFFVTFLLASLGNMAMLHTWRNLVHLDVRIISAKPVFVDDSAIVVTQITETKNRARFNIAARFLGNLVCAEDIAQNVSQTFLLPISAQKRGYMTCPRIKLSTEFPLSLFHAWAYVDSAFQVLVYPKAVNYTLKPLQSTDSSEVDGNTTIKGDDEFNGHKTYVIGDAFTRVDWKASSRGVGLLTKQFNGHGKSTLWLDWGATVGLDPEARISQMSYWVLEAFQAQQAFGLRLPHCTINPDNTEAHFHEALTALALM